MTKLQFNAEWSGLKGKLRQKFAKPTGNVLAFTDGQDQALFGHLPNKLASAAQYLAPLAILTMNHNRLSLRQLAASCLGIAFSLLVLIATPALSAPAHASAAFTLSAPSLPLAAASPGRVKASAKEFEGKTQESIGNVTGNQADRLAGKGKQVEAKIRNTVEDVKDKAGMG
jgi:uncharacterized protein YjbJ (UPF0337 family)